MGRSLPVHPSPMQTAVPPSPATQALTRCASPLPPWGADDPAAAAALDRLIDRVGDAPVVLLGEASHGTAEYYRWRRTITERLVREKGFDIVAVEGDWPDCAEVDAFIRTRTDGSAVETLRTFERWPTWMWANREVVGLIESLRVLNADRPEHERVGFYGLDVYSLWDSLHRVREYLREHVPDAADAAEDAFACFGSDFGDEQRYARRTAWLPHSCEGPVLKLLMQTRRAALADGPDAFDAEQNARVARDAERYYRAMTGPGPESWNVRDRHMTDTLARLRDRRPGGTGKAVVWEHNTHVGDARATDMAAVGMVNVGQLARERFGRENCVIVGFGSYSGEVLAGRSWGAEVEAMPLPPARGDSWDGLMHDAFADQGDGRGRGGDRLLIFPDDEPALHERRGHRAVGVVYRPSSNGRNHVPTDLADRYDAFLYLDETTALTPLHAEPTPEPGQVPDTYPAGV